MIAGKGDLEGLIAAGEVVRATLEAMTARVRPGVTTAELDEICGEALERAGAVSAAKALYSFPGFACVSLNEEIVHGVPSSRKLRPGDLVKIDLAAVKDGYFADSAKTLGVPPVSELAERLAVCAEEAFEAAMAVARAGRRLWEIGRAVEQTVGRRGFSVVRDLCGHGLGRTLHEEPLVLNHEDPEALDVLTEGLVLTVEPMIAAGCGDLLPSPNGWTLETADGSLAAHHEHTLVITSGAPRRLT